MEVVVEVVAALAAYLGFACGDALGATVEFMTRPEIAARYGVGISTIRSQIGSIRQKDRKSVV